MSKIANFLKLFLFMLFVLVLEYCCQWTIFVLVTKYGLVLPDLSPLPGTFDYWVFYQSSVVTKTLFLFLYAFIEELIFRVIPLAPVLFFDKSRKFWPIMAVVSSFLFGWAHGSLGNVFVQGIGGLILCVVFAAIYNFEHQKDEDGGDWLLAKATMVTTAIHALYNLICVSL